MWSITPHKYEQLKKWGVTYDPQDTITATLQIKRQLAEKWAHFPEERRAIADWVVKTWGGIKGNDAAKLERYIKKSATEQTHTLPFEGISTYSKIMHIANTQHHAIYDSRVAAALNAFQLLENIPHPVFFHYPNGRNAVIQRFAAIMHADLLKQQQWKILPKNEIYATYIALLHALTKSGQPSKSIHAYEMLLFSRADEWCGKALEQIDAILTQHYTKLRTPLH